MAGIDAFGFYNRHAALLLYVLVATILFVRDARAQIILISGLMLALFFTKITGFAVGLGIIAHAIVAGRVNLRTLWFTAIAIAAGLLAVEIPTGIVAAYLADVGTLVSMNQSGLLEFITKPVIGHPGIILPGLALSALLLWEARFAIYNLFSFSNDRPYWKRITIAANLEGTWLVSLILATIVYESQNTGSLEFIMLWPLAIGILYRRWPILNPGEIAIASLVVLMLLPALGQYANRALRAVAVNVTYKPLELPALDLLGMVKTKPEIITRAKAMNKHYAGNTAAYTKLMRNKQEQSYLLFSEPDFQIAWIMSINEAVNAIRAYEHKHRVRFNRLLSLDFVDPLPAILGRTPIRHISLGRMEGRTVPELTGERLKAARSADAILVPRCPVTQTRAFLLDMFTPVLPARAKIKLSPCWDMYVRPHMAWQPATLASR